MGTEQLTDQINDKTANNEGPRSNTGIGSAYKPLPKLGRNSSAVEVTYSSNASNAYITLGKDRVASRFSGEGGIGADNCDAIDIVAGPLGKGIRLKDSSGKSVKCFDPNFAEDASRIYITQKGNIDAYFGLEDGFTDKSDKPLLTSINKSAIALKSDHIRIISKELVKIVSSGTNDTNEKGGVYLIAENNQNTLESMVLGDKLVDYLDKQLVKTLSDIINNMYDFMNKQIQFNTAVINHTHISPFFGKPVPESHDLKIEINKQKELLQNSYKTIKIASNNEIANTLPLLPISNNYILSKYHKLN